MKQKWEIESLRPKKKVKKLKSKYKNEVDKIKNDEKDILEQLDEDEKEILADLWLTDEKLDQEIAKEWKEKEEVPIYGILERGLDKDEESLLLKPPKYTIPEKLIEKEFRKELEAVKTKKRYSRMNEPGTMEEKEGNDE